MHTKNFECETSNGDHVAYMYRSVIHLRLMVARKVGPNLKFVATVFISKLWGKGEVSWERAPSGRRYFELFFDIS